MDGERAPGAVETAEAVPSAAAALRALMEQLRSLTADAATDGLVGSDAIDAVRALEELKGASAGAQARVTAGFAADQRAAQRAKGVPARDVGRGIGAQVGLARRDSPHRGSRHLGLAEALVHEMPHTLAALEAGQISEWRATLVVRETACLSREDRGRVDAELAARPGGLEGLGDREAVAEARRIGYRLDPHAVTDRARIAETQRRVTLRPAPDTMSRLTGMLPAAQGVAAWAALCRAADAAKATGDARSRGQIMADTLVERVTGQSAAAGVPVEVQLHVTDTSLFDPDPGQNSEPGDLAGYGPVPAPWLRDWLRDQTTANLTDDQTQTAAAAGVWVRRVFTRPTDGQLIGMDSRRREFPAALRRFLIARDRVCRTPWCGAPIRHADHVVPAERDGPTTAGNGQGLCEACNYAKQAPDWRADTTTDGTVTTTTPTGHTYPSRPPPPIGRPPPDYVLAS